MNGERIQKHLEAAFIEKEDRLPKLLHRTLDRIEAWLREENQSERKEIPFYKQKNFEQKIYLFAHYLTKKTDCVALVKRDSYSQWHWNYMRHDLREEDKIVLKSLPPFKKKHWYRLNRNADPSASYFFLYIDQNTALFLKNSMQDQERLALFREILAKIDQL
ncbi:MAG: hypothetical protein CL674_12685 [Bdellovibrionaceae bacterium]|nr:hypothetical protein [Pseudobdellovibrionaceae bacterium]|tara:strand:+ start:431 stop:916 length:486 start_codon:yes stop_codon:yes gene_type:complete